MLPCPRPLLRTTLTCLALSLPALGVQAQGTAAPAKPRPPAKASASATTKPAAARPASSRQQLRSQAQGLALATETVENITEAQLAVATRVHTGAADCEFNQQVTVQPVAGAPGYFHVGHRGKRYRMVPRETSTGAVRLEDPAAGIVWLQIPAKSMLMNARAGQRMVDGCLHAEQRAAVAAAPDAGQGIGIQPAPADAAASR